MNNSENLSHILLYCVNYNWKQLVLDGRLRSSTMNELKNHIDYHKISKTGKKNDCLERISAHFTYHLQLKTIETRL